jgi:hypothetical protein
MANRNLDRVLAPSFLDGVETWSIQLLREARADVQLLEDAISMLRRLVQGRLDIIGSELQWRAAGGGERTLLDSLRASLSDQSEDTPESDHSAGRANTRFALPMAPAEAQSQWALHRADEAMLGNDIAAIPELTDEMLHTLADELHQLERQVSSERRLLHDRLDVLQHQIVRRYKEGEATVEGLLR